jgi:hypothetical protein
MQSGCDIAVNCQMRLCEIMKSAAAAMLGDVDLLAAGCGLVEYKFQLSMHTYMLALVLLGKRQKLRLGQ